MKPLAAKIEIILCGQRGLIAEHSRALPAAGSFVVCLRVSLEGPCPPAASHGRVPARVHI